MALLLYNGAILGQRFQTFEAHIPFILQFMIDYNVSGMGMLRAKSFKFRQPLPTSIADHSNLKHLDNSIPLEHLYLHTTVPPELLLPSSISKLSHSILELDIDRSSIVNQEEIESAQISHDNRHLNFVQPLKALWDEERQRRKISNLKTQPTQPTPSPGRVPRSPTLIDKVMIERVEELVCYWYCC